MAETIRAAGIMFLTAERQVLFLKRGNGGDFPGHWCLPGGKQEPGETLEQCAVRETTEEAGDVPPGKREELCRSTAIGFPAPINEGLPGEAAPGQQVDFTTFLQKIEKPFTPIQDDEHTGYAWAPANQPPEPLHPGVAIALRRMRGNELDIARMMAAGELSSPQKYHNVWLFSLRITGTGMAVRKEKKDKKTGKVTRPEELVWRSSDIYCNDEFLARCNGLQVIWEHPEGATLDSQEFQQRSLGAIMLPFIGNGRVGAPDEVWGIAKVYDEGAAVIMGKMQLSTSPTVVLGDEENPDLVLKTEDGRRLIIESTPKLVDHVAICWQGVWDKGGEPKGVLVETLAVGDSTDMTEEEKKAAADAQARKDAEEKADKEKADAEAKEKADAAEDRKRMADAMSTMADSLKGIHERLDSVEKKADAACAKADSVREDARKDGESEEDYKARMDKKRKDSEEAEAKAKKDAEEKEAKEKADAQAKADAEKGLSEIRKELNDLRALTKPRTPEERKAYADAQVRFDEVYNKLGRQAPAPMDGEALPDYRRRLAAGLKVHSQAWKDTDLMTVADDALYGTIEAQILQQATEFSARPDNTEVGLRMVTKREGGHEIHEFYGQPANWMDLFAGGRQRVTGKLQGNLGGNR